MNDYDLDIIRLAHEGYCCSQIVILMALELQGISNPGLIRAMNGLCHGEIGTSGHAAPMVERPALSPITAVKEIAWT